MIEVDSIINCVTIERDNCDKLNRLKQITYVTDSLINEKNVYNHLVENRQKNGFYENKQKSKEFRKQIIENKMAYTERKHNMEEMDKFNKKLEKMFDKHQPKYQSNYQPIDKPSDLINEYNFNINPKNNTSKIEIIKPKTIMEFHNKSKPSIKPSLSKIKTNNQQSKPNKKKEKNKLKKENIEIMSDKQKEKIANKDFFVIFCVVLFIKLFIY